MMKINFIRIILCFVFLLPVEANERKESRCISMLIEGLNKNPSNEAEIYEGVRLNKDFSSSVIEVEFISKMEGVEYVTKAEKLASAGYELETNYGYLNVEGLKKQTVTIDDLKLKFYVIELKDKVAEIFLTDEIDLNGRLVGCK